jgi:hypothetical protein
LEVSIGTPGWITELPESFCSATPTRIMRFGRGESRVPFKTIT